MRVSSFDVASVQPKKYSPKVIHNAVRGACHVQKITEWKTYRTRFLVRARQLTAPMLLVDALGREHFGDTGDYLVESSDGTQRIAQRLIFEDIYVAIHSSEGNAAGVKKRRPGVNRVRQGDEIGQRTASA
ncbi:MAG: hypothetical protein M3O09_19565 [Acidobacteriota bacterium]|jgi:hypothetical protein|nr:hypothetical protein [Acidobacteriota bacterium]